MKKVFTLLLIVLCSWMLTAASVSDLSYSISNGEVTITGCDTSASGALAIPKTLSGYRVTSIGDFAFWGCSSLTSVTISEGVKTIGEGAFFGCSGLTSVTIPLSVTSIGDDAFSYCSSLTSFVVDSANQHYTVMNKLLYSRDGKTLIACPGGLTSVTIPSSVTSIGSYAFYGCSNLKITVDSANPIYASLDGALFNKAMTELIRGPGATSNYTIPSSVTEIGDAAFSGCYGLTSVTIPEGVKSIGDDAFYDCSGLTSVTIPSSVTSVGDWAFSWCSGLTSVTIPEGVTTIGEYAFGDCSGLTSVTIPSSVTSIGNGAFEGCLGLKSVTIPSSVKTIGEHAFKYCSSLTSVTIPSSVTSIGNGAFEGCRGLKSVTIPSSVTSIGERAFYGCSGLTSVMFEGVPPKVGSEVFDRVASGCKGYYLPMYAAAWEAVIVNGKWNGLTMEEEQIPTFAVRATVVGDGQVAGTGKYEAGAEVTLTAVPGEGSVFCGWSVPSVKSATYTFTMPNEPVEVIAYFADATVLEKYITANDLISKDEAKQALLDAGEIITSEQLQVMAMEAPVIAVENGVAKVGVSLKRAESLDGEWEQVEVDAAEISDDGAISVSVPAGEKASFYKFVVPEK